MRIKTAERLLAATNSDIRRMDQKEDFGYKQISGDGPMMFQNPVRQHTQINDSYAMWIKNPLAKFIIDTLLDFAWGDGLSFEANDTAIYELLSDYYYDIDNDWDGKGEKRIQDMSIYGELFLRNYIAENTGKVKCASIFPGAVSDTVLDPENIEKIKQIIVDGVNGPVPLDVLSWDSTKEAYTGDVSVYMINNTVHQKRGLSDLFVRRDWLTLYDKSMYSTMERIGLLLSFVWDVAIQNAKEPELKKKRLEILKDPPKPGSVRIHNELEKWTAESPDIRAGDLDVSYRLLRSQAMGGLPEHFWGLGGDVNLATAEAMSDPFFRKVKRRQRLILSMFRQQFDYVIWQADQHGMLKGVKDKKYAIMLPEPDKNLVTTYSKAIMDMSQSITTLETSGYIDYDDAKNVVNMLFRLIGMKPSSGETQEEADDNDKSNPETEDKKLVAAYKRYTNTMKGGRNV